MLSSLLVDPGSSCRPRAARPARHARPAGKGRGERSSSPRCSRSSRRCRSASTPRGSEASSLVLQGLDASGKDGTIRHVFTGVNPQGCRVTSFKAPTPLELAHDFLWRVHAECPARGMIGIFNRSHYEDVVTVRVLGLAPEEVWRRRPSGSSSSSATSPRRGRRCSSASSTSRPRSSASGSPSGSPIPPSTGSSTRTTRRRTAATASSQPPTRKRSPRPRRSAHPGT